MPDSSTAPALRGGAPARRAALREWLLLLGFALVVVAAALTVAVPELSKEPEADANTSADAGVASK